MCWNTAHEGVRHTAACADVLTMSFHTVLNQYPDYCTLMIVNTHTDIDAEALDIRWRHTWHILQCSVLQKSVFL